MQNRIIIKSIEFYGIKNKDKDKDIIIKLYHNKMTESSDVFVHDQKKINWKFIIDYNKNLPIYFIIFEKDIHNNETMIVNFSFKNKRNNYCNPCTWNFSCNLFPKPIIKELELIKNDTVIGKIVIHQYILSNMLAYFYPCGKGWDLPNTFPQLDNYSLKRTFNIYKSIKLITDKFEDQKPKYDFYSEAFLHIINDKNNNPPFCFGIIGPDNFGKTDLLKSLKRKLYENKSNIDKKRVIIDFNPWSFESDDTIWSSILMRIHDELENDFGKFNLKWNRIKKNLFPDIHAVNVFMLKILLISVSLFVFIYFNFTNMISNVFVTIFLSMSTLLLLKDLIQLGRNMLFSIPNLIMSKIKKPDWSSALGFMHEIKKEFFDFINPIVKDNNYQVILLIDDLDKCSIEKIYLVIKVLSLIKYSDCPIYMVLTYNSVKITEAINNYYKLKYFSLSTNMVNKLVNIPFCLPGRDIVENLNLLDENLEEIQLEDNNLLREQMNEYITIDISDNKYLSTNKKGLTNEKDTTNLKLDDIDSMITNNDDINIYQLETYYKHLSKMKDTNNEDRIIKLRNTISEKFIEMKNNFIKSYYSGLDKVEIKLFQLIIENTKNSGIGLTNENVIKIINIYSISRFLLPPYLKIKKEILLHFIVITEIWLKIIVKIYHEMKRKKFNLNYTEMKEIFKDKTLLFFYLNNNIVNHHNDDLILYLTKFELYIIDFIDLEPYIFNLDRCL